MCVFFFFKQKTAYEMRISDWSSDVCSSDLPEFVALGLRCQPGGGVYMTLVPKSGLSLPPAGRPLLVNFTGSEGGYDATQTLVQEPGKSDFRGPIDPGVEGLLIGADTGLDPIAKIGRASCRERVCQYV